MCIPYKGKMSSFTCSSEVVCATHTQTRRSKVTASVASMISILHCLRGQHECELLRCICHLEASTSKHQAKPRGRSVPNSWPLLHQRVIPESQRSRSFDSDLVPFTLNKSRGGMIDEWCLNIRLQQYIIVSSCFMVILQDFTIVQRNAVWKTRVQAGSIAPAQHDKALGAIPSALACMHAHMHACTHSHTHSGGVAESKQWYSYLIFKWFRKISYNFSLRFFQN